MVICVGGATPLGKLLEQVRSLPSGTGNDGVLCRQAPFFWRSDDLKDSERNSKILWVDGRVLCRTNCLSLTKLFNYYVRPKSSLLGLVFAVSGMPLSSCPCTLCSCFSLWRLKLSDKWRRQGYPELP